MRTWLNCIYITISYYNALGSFVCLFPIQIGAAARCSMKRAMHAEGCLVHVQGTGVRLPARWTREHLDGLAECFA